MTGGALHVAHVQMPEKGVFTVRCAPGTERLARGADVMVNLDYGLDTAKLRTVAPYDPDRDGPNPPGFLLARARTEADAAQLARNAAEGAELRRAYAEAARRVVPDIRVPYARVSFARTRLFVRFVTEAVRPDLSAVNAEMRRRCGMTVNAWQMGPRDEVRTLGALGPCGRACCCAAWQQKYPARTHDLPRGRGAAAAALNGVCGRYKCCLAFERGEA